MVSQGLSYSHGVPVLEDLCVPDFERSSQLLLVFDLLCHSLLAPLCLLQFCNETNQKTVSAIHFLQNQ